MTEQQNKTGDDPANINTELAKERTYAAYERTYLAWVRTALAMMGFGVGIFEFAREHGGNTIFKSSKFIGLMLIFLSALCIFLALLDVKKNTARLSDPNFRYNRSSTLGIRIGYILLFITLIALIRSIYRMIVIGI